MKKTNYLKRVNGVLLGMFVSVSVSVNAQAPINGSKITFKTGIPEGEVLVFGVTADEQNVWIDLNNNKQCDSNEKITDYSMPLTLDENSYEFEEANKIGMKHTMPMQYKILRVPRRSNEKKIKNQTLTIYGKMTALAVQLSSIKEINLSECPTLERLDISYNPYLKKVDVTKLPKLYYLAANNTGLTKLDLSQNKELAYLELAHNHLQSIDISQNNKLRLLSIGTNELTDIDLTKNPELIAIYIFNNKIKNLDLSKNKKITCISCPGTLLTKLDVSMLHSLRKLYCSYSNISKLELKNNLALEDLDCSYTEIKELDITHNTKLQILECQGNKLKSLDLSKNQNLNCLFCYENQFGERAMGNIVNALPKLGLNPEEEESSINEEDEPGITSLWGAFVVVNTAAIDNNICTDKMVKIAKEKGWTAYDFKGDMELSEIYQGITAAIGGVSSTKIKGLNIVANGKKLKITAAENIVGKELYIYNAAGKMVKKLIAQPSIIIDMDGNAQGIYVIKCGNTVCKQIVK